MTDRIISKNDFHYKLMKFTLGESRIPKNNFCPYFWLSILSYFMAPFITIIKTFKFIIIVPLESLVNKIRQVVRRKNYENFILSEENLILGWYAYFSNRRFNDLLVINDKDKLKVSNNYGYYYFNFKKWWEAGENPTKVNYIHKILTDKAQKIVIKQKSEIGKLITFNKKFSTNNLMKISKTSFYGISILIFVFATVEIILFLNDNYVFSYVYFMKILSVLGIALIIVILVLSLTVSIIYLFNTTIPNLYKNSTLEVFVNKVRDSFSVFGKMVLSWKENNCPGIIWKEDKSK